MNDVYVNSFQFPSCQKAFVEGLVDFLPSIIRGLHHETHDTFFEDGYNDLEYGKWITCREAFLTRAEYDGDDSYGRFSPENVCALIAGIINAVKECITGSDALESGSDILGAAAIMAYRQQEVLLSTYMSGLRDIRTITEGRLSTLQVPEDNPKIGSYRVYLEETLPWMGDIAQFGINEARWRKAEREEWPEERIQQELTSGWLKPRQPINEIGVLPAPVGPL